MSDLFNNSNANKSSPDYRASDIEVLEGLEAVRHRPGMYIGGTDEQALHHLVSEIFDNAMDEAVAGFANKITVEVTEDLGLKISDNGRGIPIDDHPKYPGKSAVEIIATVLHAGGKFNNKVYQTSGGLHGVGLSVVNALSEIMIIEVTRNKVLYRQEFACGIPTTPLNKIGPVTSKNGSSIYFKADPSIFGHHQLRAHKIYQFIRAKAYLNKNIEIKWICPEIFTKEHKLPTQETIKSPGGLADYLKAEIQHEPLVIDQFFSGDTVLNDDKERIEWSVAWTNSDDQFVKSFCNTIPTINGGSHEQAFRSLLTKAVKDYGQMVANKKVNLVIGDDINNNTNFIISLFMRNPQFQGQTKEKLVNQDIGKIIETTVKHHFDHWLSHNKTEAEALLNFFIEKAEERIQRKLSKEANKKSIQRTRLPGKLADCAFSGASSELFIVEGDSAGGSAKQARNREFQAIMPIRGKILNVASNTQEKLFDNQQLADLELALGCGTGKNYQEAKLRYDKVIIMTDADVDGAHIASLLMTYFFRQMLPMIQAGHLYLAKPPLYRIKVGNNITYAADDREKAKILGKTPNAEVNRFKGLGEMTASQLKETTMDPKSRVLYQVVLDDMLDDANQSVEELMGKKPELRFKFIKEQTLLKGQQLKDDLDL